jgi:hypothetical protein
MWVTAQSCKRISKVCVDAVRVLKIRSGKGGTESVEDNASFCVTGNVNHHIGVRFFVL